MALTIPAEDGVRRFAIIRNVDELARAAAVQHQPSLDTHFSHQGMQLMRGDAFISQVMSWLDHNDGENPAAPIQPERGARIMLVGIVTSLTMVFLSGEEPIAS